MHANRHAEGQLVSMPRERSFREAPRVPIQLAVFDSFRRLRDFIKVQNIYVGERSKVVAVLDQVSGRKVALKIFRKDKLSKLHW
jgi:hypothetical protein